MLIAVRIADRAASHWLPLGPPAWAMVCYRRRRSRQRRMPRRDQVDGAMGGAEIVRHRDGDGGFLFRGGDQRDHARTQPFEQVRGDRAEFLGRDLADIAGDEFQAADHFKFSRGAQHELLLQLGELAFQALFVFLQLSDAGGEFRRLAPSALRRLRRAGGCLPRSRLGGSAGHRLDAADAGGDRAFARRCGTGRYRRCGAHACRRTARSNRRLVPRRLAHRDDAHLVAVFLAEQRHGAELRRPRRASSAGW